MGVGVGMGAGAFGFCALPMVPCDFRSFQKSMAVSEVSLQGPCVSHTAGPFQGHSQSCSRPQYHLTELSILSRTYARV